MLDATRQLLEDLGALDALRQAGETPDPSQIRELFRLRHDAQAEVDAIASSELRTAIVPAGPAADEFNQDAPAPPAGAESSHPAEDSARVDAATPDAIDRIEESLQRAVREGVAPRRQRGTTRPRPAKAARPRRKRVS